MKDLGGLKGVLKEEELFQVLNALQSWNETILCDYIQVIISIIDKYSSPATTTTNNNNKWNDFKNRLYSIGLKVKKKDKYSVEYKKVRSRLDSSLNQTNSSFSSSSFSSISRVGNESSLLGNTDTRKNNENSFINNEYSSFSNENSRIGTEKPQFGFEGNRFYDENSFPSSNNNRISNNQSMLNSDYSLQNADNAERKEKKVEPNLLPIVFLFLFLFLSLFLVVFVSWKAYKPSAPISTEEFYVSPNFDAWVQNSQSEISEIDDFSESRRIELEKHESPVKSPESNQFMNSMNSIQSSTARIREEEDAFIIEDLSESEAPPSDSSSNTVNTVNVENVEIVASTASTANTANTANTDGETHEDLVEIAFSSDGLPLNVLLLILLILFCIIFNSSPHQ